MLIIFKNTKDWNFHPVIWKYEKWTEFLELKKAISGIKNNDEISSILETLKGELEKTIKYLNKICKMKYEETI